MERYNKGTSKGRPRHERTEIKAAQGERDRNKVYMLQCQNQTQWHPKTEAASWNEGREIAFTLRRTVTHLSNTSSNTMKDRIGIARFKLEIWRLRRIRGCNGEARCRLCAEVKVNFTVLPRQKGTEGQEKDGCTISLTKTLDRSVLLKTRLGRLTPWNDQEHTVGEDGWVGPDGCGNSRPQRDSIPRLPGP
jgi:hypothetical protein